MSVDATPWIGGGGGATLPLDITNPMNVAAVDQYDAPDDSVWLKSGVVETDTALFPDATANQGAYSGTSFSIAGEDANPAGIAWDGTFFWVLGNQNDSVFKYNAAGVYQSVSFSVASEDTSPASVVWDGTFFWVLGNGNKAVFKYNSAGVYQSVSFSVNAEDINPQGLTWDGTFFWMVGSDTDAVYKYNSSGVYQSVSFSVASELAPTPVGLTWDGTYFWVVGATDIVFRYTAAGVYTGYSFSAATEETGVTDITSVGDDLWIVGNINDTAFKYVPAVGIINASTDTDTGLPEYVRVALGDGNVPINGTLVINSQLDSYTDSDGGIWLKSGVVDTDTGSFPDATIVNIPPDAVGLETEFTDTDTGLPIYTRVA